MILHNDSYQTFLKSELERRQGINSRYSLRSFARHLSLSPGELSEVMKGRRKLTIKSSLKVAKALGLNTTETKHLLSLVEIEKSESLGLQDLLTSRFELKKEEPLTMDMFRIVSDWFYFAILNLFDAANFQYKAKDIARLLDIPFHVARMSMERLEKVGLVHKVNGTYRVAKDFVISPSGIPSEAIRNYHRTILQKASEALDFQKVDERDITGVGFAFDAADMPSIRKDIQEFQEKIAAKYLRSKNKTHVYQLEVAFFKLSNGTGSLK